MVYTYITKRDAFLDCKPVQMLNGMRVMNDTPYYSVRTALLLLRYTIGQFDERNPVRMCILVHMNEKRIICRRTSKTKNRFTANKTRKKIRSNKQNAQSNITQFFRTENKHTMCNAVVIRIIAEIAVIET